METETHKQTEWTQLTGQTEADLLIDAAQLFLPSFIPSFFPPSLFPAGPTNAHPLYRFLSCMFFARAFGCTEGGEGRKEERMKG
mmetsp:Transcript_1542/g.3216  ORF Transcript_1542/g.3216 Transcript_1542/m.3216 type:complete len:84 (-) Transcript_1542:365-616(-)